MHIPDGYLSPSTCATLYALATAGWYAALRRIKRMLQARMVPLISVFAAFSFVVMMFNVPLPGGTTGHAIGVAVAAIVLGPSGSILAISIALAIQALFFGDGGITTLGANCFNMAIAGSLAAYFTFRLIAAGCNEKSRRRIWAAAVAGYVAINVSAFLAAVEFGIQPQLFHTASGAPLYAPYPLRIAIPAMMIGHLTIAGLAEALISAGMISYLQHADIGLLRGTRIFASAAHPALVTTRSLQRVWLIVALLMVLTPLGILATGTAWGEWSGSDFQRSDARAQIAAASHADPPIATPSGLARLSTLWTAPFPAYAPAFIRHPAIGYLLSAVFGVGLLMAAYLLLRWITRRQIDHEAQA